MRRSGRIAEAATMDGIPLKRWRVACLDPVHTQIEQRHFVNRVSGANGGTDTFSLDGTVGTTWDMVVNVHAGDSAAL